MEAVNRIRADYVSLYLRPSQWLILSRIIWNSTYHALEKMQVRRSCFASRQYFRDAFGYHVSTVSEITTELVGLGLISKVQLRPIEGRYQRCMYKLDGKLWEIVKGIIMYLIKQLSRVAKRRHKDTNTLNKTIHKKEKSDFSYKLKSKEWTDIEKDFYNRRPELV